MKRGKNSLEKGQQIHDVRLEKKSELIELSCSIGPSVRGSSKYGEDLKLRNCINK